MVLQLKSSNIASPTKISAQTKSSWAQSDYGEYPLLPLTSATQLFNNAPFIIRAKTRPRADQVPLPANEENNAIRMTLIKTHIALQHKFHRLYLCNEN